MPAKAPIEGYVDLTFKFHKEGENWLAECLELGTATFAPTLEEAQKDIASAISAQLRDCQELRELREYLRSHKVRIHKTRPRGSRKLVDRSNGKALYQPLVLPVRGKASRVHKHSQDHRTPAHKAA